MIGLVIGCGSTDTPRAEQFSVVDSGGVALATSARPAWSDSTGWRVADTPSVVIGGDDASERELLLGVLGAGRLPDGRVAVLQRSTSDVRFFDRHGGWTGLIGRRGLGPAEFSDPQHLMIVGDTLLVWQARYGRVSRFNIHGVMIDERYFDLERLSEAYGPSRRSEWYRPLPDGSVVATMVSIQGEPEDHPGLGGRVRPSHEYLLIRPDYSSADLGQFPGREITLLNQDGRRSLFPAFFAHRSSVAAGGNPLTIYAATGDRFEVQRFDTTGHLAGVIRWDRPRTVVTSAQFDSSVSIFLERNARTPEARRVLRDAFDDIRRPETFPPIDALLVDSEGFLWVQGLGHGWSVFDPDGRWLGDLKVPLDVVSQIGPDFILGLVSDQDGVEQVLEYQLDRVPQH